MENKLLWLILAGALLLKECSQKESECHCATDCSRNPSAKCRKCQKGWYGPYCQKRNVALNGQATQQGFYTENSRNTDWKTVDFTADLAVDGVFHTADRENFFSKPLTCAHTNRKKHSWWRVTINSIGTNQIKHMRIYNRQRPWTEGDSKAPTVRDRRNGMEILVDGQQCYKWMDSVTPPDIAKVTCYTTLTGDVVTIRVPEDALSLCEVQVFVCSDFWFGQECDQQCRCRDSSEVCDKVTGHCQSGCQAGFIGEDCQQETERTTTAADEIQSTESHATQWGPTVTSTLTVDEDQSTESNATQWGPTVTSKPILTTGHILSICAGIVALCVVLALGCIQLRKKNNTGNETYDVINRPVEMEHCYTSMGEVN